MSGRFSTAFSVSTTNTFFVCYHGFMFMMGNIKSAFVLNATSAHSLPSWRRPDYHLLMIIARHYHAGDIRGLPMGRIRRIRLSSRTWTVSIKCSRLFSLCDICSHGINTGQATVFRRHQNPRRQYLYINHGINALIGSICTLIGASMPSSVVPVLVPLSRETFSNLAKLSSNKTKNCQAERQVLHTVMLFRLRILRFGSAAAVAGASQIWCGRGQLCYHFRLQCIQRLLSIAFSDRCFYSAWYISFGFDFGAGGAVIWRHCQAELGCCHRARILSLPAASSR